MRRNGRWDTRKPDQSPSLHSPRLQLTRLNGKPGNKSERSTNCIVARGPMTLKDYPRRPVGSARLRPLLSGILARAFLRFFALSMPKRRRDRHDRSVSVLPMPPRSLLDGLGAGRRLFGSVTFLNGDDRKRNAIRLPL